MSTLLCINHKVLPLIAILAALPVLAEPTAVVGEATLVIGAAQVTGDDGTAAAIKRGMPVHVGDRIETQPGGHVHVRFVDGGRVSVRPASRLVVENYSQSDGSQGPLGAIKFRLEEGVVRSITGAWGEAARDRFRLNTPVAAIGVKGTDFVARFANGVTYASVYAGAITMTPLEGGCMMTVGPCLNGAERLLASDSPGQILELARQQATAQLIPVADHLARTYLSTQTTTAAVATVLQPTVVVAAATPAAAVVGAPASSGSKLAESSIVRADASPEKMVSNESHVLAVLQDSQSALPLQRSNKGPQFAWGRVSFAPGGGTPAEGDTISVAMDAARTAGMVAVTSGALDVPYRLFRDPTTTFNSALLQGVKANFVLAGGAAQLARRGGVVVEPVRVDAGSLSVDFDRAAFETSLSLSNRTINTLTLSEVGKIDPATGLLRGAHTAGAVSADATSAAYSFAHDVAMGRLTGITLWGR